MNNNDEDDNNTPQISLFSHDSTDLTVQQQQSTDVLSVEDIEVADSDFKYARDKLIQLLEDSADVLEHARSIADETGEPKAVDTYAGMLRSVAKITKDLVELSRTRKAIKTSPNSSSSGNRQEPHALNQINNSIYLGSTSELSKFLEEIQSGSDVIEVKNDKDAE